MHDVDQLATRVDLLAFSGLGSWIRTLVNLEPKIWAMTSREEHFLAWEVAR